MTEISYKHVDFGEKFTFDNVTYVKTNFNRGYYYKDGAKVFRKFRKSTIVKIEGTPFDVVPKK